MANYQLLKADIDEKVYQNGKQEITGENLNSVLNAMVASLGAGYQFMGVATLTNPGTAQTPDYKCFYLATTPGTYTNLGGLVVADGEVALLKWDSTWTKQVTGIATAEKVNQLGQQVLNNFIIGANSTLVKTTIVGLLPNCPYRISLPNPNFSRSGDTIPYKHLIFGVSAVSNEVETYIFKIDGDASTLLNNYYDFVTPAQFDRIQISCRATMGVRVEFNLEALNIFDKFNKIYFWQQGTNGTTPGTIAPSGDLRCITFFENVASCKLFYNINSDYSIYVSEWNDEDTTFYHPLSWFSGSGVYNITKKNISVVIKKNTDSVITPGDITNTIVDINISNVFNTSLDVIMSQCKEIEVHNNFVQGTIYTSGEKIGQIEYSKIRCVAVLDVPTGTGISVVLEPGYKATVACYNDGDTNTYSSGFRKGATTFMTFGEHSYLIIGKNDDSNITPSEAIGNVVACSSEIGNPILASINKLEEDIKERSDKIHYIGEALPFNKTMQIKEYKTISNWVNSQAGTVYGDFLVVALAMDEVADGNPNGHLYNIKTGEHISNLSFGNTLGGKTYTMPHGNQICFGKEFYDENSVFPLLYVSQTTLYEKEANKGELGVLVYDIQKVSDTEYTPVLVQAIIPDLEDINFRNKISKWTTNYVVDTDNDKLYLVGYPRMWDWSDIYNSVKGYYPISKFTLPKISDGEEIVLTNSMLEDNYQIYRETAIQMILYNRGKVYIQGGFNGAYAPKYLDAVDLCSHAIVSQINLSNVRTLEPQGLFIYDNRLLWYDAGTSGKIDEFIF